MFFHDLIILRNKFSYESTLSPTVGFGKDIETIGNNYFLKLFAGKQLMVSVPLIFNTVSRQFIAVKLSPLYFSVECMVKIESDAQIICL